MLNAVKNAKIVGYLLFIAGLIDLVFALSTASEFTGNAVALGLIYSVGELIVAYGLIKTKQWSIYGVGALAVYNILTIFYNYSVNTSPTKGGLVMLGIYVILFFWFFSDKKKFQK